MNTESKKSLLRRLLHRVFPPTTDFFGLLNAQADIVAIAGQCFRDFMKTHDPKLGLRVRELEHEADQLKHANMDALNRSFATPIDRDDILRAIVSLDDIIGYAKTTVREMEILNVDPDESMQQMADLLLDGVMALKNGYGELRKHPIKAEPFAKAAHKTERAIERVYRQAVADLLDENRIMREIDPSDCQAFSLAISGVVQTMRRRELYRHLSNAGDRVEIAAETLHNIVVKIE